MFLLGKREPVRVEFREATDADLGYVYGGWLSSFFGAHASGPLDEDIYRKVYRLQIKRLLAKADVQCIVAYNLDDPSHVVGFICVDGSLPDIPVVHFISVKLLYRRKGLARALLTVAGIDPTKPFCFTFKTAITSRLKSWTGARWNPLIFRNGKAEEES